MGLFVQEVKPVNHLGPLDFEEDAQGPEKQLTPASDP